MKKKNSVCNKEYKLIPHGLFCDRSFEQFCLEIPEFYFKKGVPKDVIKNFEVIEKLLVHSYYEYRFIDEAYFKALNTLEMAMRFKYKEIYPEENKKLSFNSLVKPLYELNFFDTNLDVLLHLKGNRNRFAHPERYSHAGIIFWNGIDFVNRIINEMYEDRDLRTKRKLETEEFIRIQKELNLGSFALLEHDNEKSILFESRLLHVNNKKTPSTYLLACTPIFNLESEEKNTVLVPNTFRLTLKNVIATDKEIHAINFETEKRIKIYPVDKNKKLKKVLDSWVAAYNHNENKFMYPFSIEHNFPAILIPAINEFQKMESFHE